MATSFVQQTEGVRPTSIGNQQIVQRDLSYINTLNDAVDTVTETVDQVGTAVGKQRAKDAVEEAQKQVETERAEAEELAELNALGDDASADEVARKTALLEKGVAQGKITRENARLRVADLVTKKIEENPIFASKIRQSAERLLGFNLESEATRQFFGSFEPAGRTSPSGKFERDVAALHAAGLSQSEARRRVAKLAKLENEAAINKLEFDAGLKGADQFIASRINANSSLASGRFADTLLNLRATNADINAKELEGMLAQDKIAVKNSIIADMIANKQSVTAETAANIDDQLQSQYDNLVTIAKGADSFESLERDLKQFQTMTTLSGMEALPRLTAMKATLGERLTVQYLEMIDAAGGDEQQLKNLLSTSPALREVHEAFSGNLEDFPRLIDGVMQKLQDGTITNPDGSPNVTPEQAKVLDGIQQTLAGPKADPETKEEVAKLFSDNNLEARASQIILGARASLATPKQVQAIKNKWNNLSGSAANRLIEEISKDSNKSLQLEMRPSGLHVSRRAFSPSGVVRIPANDTPAGRTALELNQYLQSTARGWGDVLGIADSFKTGTDIVNRVNDSLEAQSTAAEAASTQATEAKEARRQQRGEAITTGQRPAIDLRTLQADDPARYDRLLEEAARRAGVQL